MPKMTSAHAERDVDVTNAGRGIWLVKVPKFLRDQWSDPTTTTEVGRLRLAANPPGSKRGRNNITFSMDEHTAREAKLPREHKFITHDIKQSLAVFSLPKVEEGQTPPQRPSISLEGQVNQKFECQPFMDENYLALKLASRKAAATPARKAIAIGRPAVAYKPKTHHDHLQQRERVKETEGKKAREDKDVVLEKCFAAFEKHQYYNIKDLMKLTNQPITYLKEILKEICDYNLKNPHKHTWELKREYRHYKEGDDKGEE